MPWRGLRTKINLAIFLTTVLVGVAMLGLLYPLEQQRRENRLEDIRELLAAVYQQNREQMANEIFAKQWRALSGTGFPSGSSSA